MEDSSFEVWTTNHPNRLQLPGAGHYGSRTRWLHVLAPVIATIANS